MASAVASTSSYVFPHDAASPAPLFVSPADLFAPAAPDYQDAAGEEQQTAFEVEEEEVDPRSLLGSVKLRKGQATEMSGGRLKRYMCTWPGCGKCYARPTRLEEHQRVHTGERPFVCSVCDANFQRDSHLKAHSRVHLDDSARPCACTEEGCEKKFWTNQHLKKHIEQVHRGNKYKCDECDASFRKHHQLRSHALQEHSPEATDVKPFECTHPGCGKTFKQKQHLKGHEKTHDTSRYACMHPDCASLPAESRQFGTWTLLQRHNKTVHPPTCRHPDCRGRVFANSRSLRNHLALHERDEKEANGEVVPDEGGKKKRRRRNKKKKVSSSDVDETRDAVEGAAVDGAQQDDDEVEEGSDWEARQESERDERMREDFRHGGKKKRKVLHEAAGFPPLPLPPSLAGLAGSPALEDIPEGLPVPPAAFLADPPADSSQHLVDLVTGANYAAAPPQASGSGSASAEISRSPSKGGGGGLANVPRKYSCPFPAILELPFKDLGQPSRPASPALDEGDRDGDDGDEGTCRYWFKRVYDVERHLRAKHGIEMVGGRQVLDDYFKAEAEE